MASDEILEAKEVAKMLKVHERTIARLADRGELEGFKIGNLWRFYRSDIDKYIQAQKEKQRKHE